jgi:hypothetical protein
MKRNWMLFLLTVVALGTVPALAGAQAVVIKDTSCEVLSPNGLDFVPIDTIKVTTPSKNCNINVSCHGELPAGAPIPDKAEVFNYDNTNLMCTTTFDSVQVSTANWHEVITPSGNVSLTCHFKDCPPTSCNPNSPDFLSCCEQNPYATGCTPV